MQLIRLVTVAIIILFGLSSIVNSETSWITKKKEKKTEINKKEDGVIDVKSWIKKKKINKKLFKKKEKESKSWISKKTKEEKKEEKEILKNHLQFNDLPKANFYFVAQNQSTKQTYYGYVEVDKNSQTFKVGNQTYFRLSKGYAYINDDKTTCTVNSKLDTFLNKLAGEVIVKCKNGVNFSGDFTQKQKFGSGTGTTNKGDDILFKFSQDKELTLAVYKEFEQNKIRLANVPKNTDVSDESIELKPNGNYYALLIGNSNYEKHGEWENLVSPQNDIKEIAKILRTKYRFKKVITATDVNRYQLFQKFEQLAKITTDKDYVFIYYSGHGDIKSSQSYWIPVNASLTSRSEWINISDITTYIEEDIRAHHIALLVDSCYFAVTTKSMTDTKSNKSSLALEKLLETRARIVMASGQSERVEDATNNRKHSKFGLTVINSLKANTKVIKLYDIFLNQGISHATVKQKPYYAVVMNWGHLGGDFLFIAKE